VLSFLRFKILFVHLTNVYDNLTFDEIARRDNKLYVIEVRPYISAAALELIKSEFGFGRAELLARSNGCWRMARSPSAITRRAWRSGRGSGISSASKSGCAPSMRATKGTCRRAATDPRWTMCWQRCRTTSVPPLTGRGGELRQHCGVASPAGLPAGAGHLRHQHQGLRAGLPRPWKADGSFVTWVNGAFLHAVGARAGYHVNFAPFTYRKGSKTQILYTQTARLI
jgi:hypothetical protein